MVQVLSFLQAHGGERVASTADLEHFDLDFWRERMLEERLGLKEDGFAGRKQTQTPRFFCALFSFSFFLGGGEGRGGRGDVLMSHPSFLLSTSKKIPPNFSHQPRTPCFPSWGKPG